MTKQFFFSGKEHRQMQEDEARTVAKATELPVDALKPVERQIEARAVDDSQGSMVRCLYFSKSYIISVQVRWILQKVEKIIIISLELNKSFLTHLRSKM